MSQTQARLRAVELRQDCIEDRVCNLEEGGKSFFREIRDYCLVFALGLAIGFYAFYSPAPSPTPQPEPQPVPPVVTPEPTPEPVPEQSFKDRIQTIAVSVPAPIRDKWAWCYVESVKNYTTPIKLREDVRRHSANQMNDAERNACEAADAEIVKEVEKETRPIKDVYADIGDALKVNDWQPTPSKKPPTTGQQKPSVRPKGLFQRMTCSNGVCRPI